ncbi:unnamed protein product [Caenorhabditis bovis]|uniref:Uncharacterized protein n=1 Tax=Caenorhabditis bovis TaxID=2654633 RepID=A0A8S1E0K2_9PELO|nr:unnamed protein product [Caenorhabditis bovis]
MDFRDVWMKSDSPESQLVHCPEHLRHCQDISVMFIVISFLLLLINIGTITFINRKRISRKFRETFFQLPIEDADSAIFPAVYPESTELKNC